MLIRGLTKAIVRKNTMREVIFRKCSRCHRFSEIFQCIINRRRNTNSRIFLQKPFKTILRMENIGQKYHDHKISVKYLIMT